jgi:hypothetical protein
MTFQKRSYYSRSAILGVFRVFSRIDRKRSRKSRQSPVRKFSLARETREPQRSASQAPPPRRFVKPNVSLPRQSTSTPHTSAAGPAQSQSHRAPSNARELPGGRGSFLSLAARGAARNCTSRLGGNRRIPLAVAGRSMGESFERACLLCKLGDIFRSLGDPATLVFASVISASSAGLARRNHEGHALLPGWHCKACT